MEITVEAVVEAIKTNPELVSGILPTIQETDVVKNLINNKAEVIYKDKIGDEVKNIYSQFDNDAFSIIGEKPQVDENGRATQKTYDFFKEKLTELKNLRGQKDSLNKDTKVQELLGQIENLKQEGGAKHVQEVFDAAKQTWETERQDLISKLEQSKGATIDFQKKTAINDAIRQIKFNPDTSESIRKMVIENAERQLISNSKFEDGKLIFTDAEGKPAIDTATYQPKTALQMLTSMDAIKDISLKDGGKKGGGAKPTITGSIQTTSVEGKDTKKLVLPEGSFKTQEEFVQVSEKALMESGISKRDPNFDRLQVEAYKELKVADLPTN